jgi:hypothetical protein
VIAVPGLTPRSSARTVVPVLVTVDPPNTEYVPASASTNGTAACARYGIHRTQARSTALSSATPPTIAAHLSGLARLMGRPCTELRSTMEPSADK